MFLISFTPRSVILRAWQHTIVGNINLFKSTPHFQLQPCIIIHITESALCAFGKEMTMPIGSRRDTIRACNKSDMLHGRSVRGRLSVIPRFQWEYHFLNDFSLIGQPELVINIIN